MSEITRGFAARAVWEVFCDRFVVYSFTDLRQRRRMSGENELWIAARALEAGGTLVARNLKHFQKAFVGSSG